MTIERKTTKEAFGGEVQFTDFLGGEDGRDHLVNLFVECFGHADSLENAITEKHTSQGKRVDIVVRNDNRVVTIECQDACGTLDANHAGKSQVYAYTEGALYNILLCETSNEEMRSYIRFENEHPAKNNFLIEYRIIGIEGSSETHIEWIPIVKPIETSLKRKQTRKTLENVDRQKRTFNTSLTEVFQGKFPMEMSGVFRGQTYNATLQVDGSVTMNGETYGSINKACTEVVQKGKGYNAWSCWTHDGFFLTTYRLDKEGILLEDVEGTWREKYHPDKVGYSPN